MDHIHDLESGAVALFKRDVPMPVREDLGRQWMAFVTAFMADNTGGMPSG